MATYGYIGLGLIGGSLAKSIRKAEPDAVLMAADRSLPSLRKAKEEGLIDRICSEDDPAFSECDMIFLCTPVQDSIGYLPFLRDHARRDCILTDVGSVKGIVADAAADCGLSGRFIGGHPMAGTEKSGLENATDYLLENAFWFITPGPDSDTAAVGRYEHLIRRIHAIPIRISPEEHDRVVAGVSHLPHVAASALVNTLRELDTDDEIMKLVAAGGFRDITRIASSSPKVWEQICLTNQEAICRALTAYIYQLVQARTCIENGDRAAVRAMFSAARDHRDSLDDTRRGAVERQYILYIDIYDEAGGIAAITALLAAHDINIRNIGIIHNREFEEGVLRLELYEESVRDAAETILLEHHYIVRKRV